MVADTSDPVDAGNFVGGLGFGGRIQRARREARLTRDQLGRLVGVHPKTIARWERSLAVPREQHIFKLASELGVRPMWLFDGKGEMQARRRPAK